MEKMGKELSMRLSDAGLEFNCANCGKYKHYPDPPDGLLCISRMMTSSLPQPLCEVCAQAVDEALKRVKNKPVGEA